MTEKQRTKKEQEKRANARICCGMASIANNIKKKNPASPPVLTNFSPLRSGQGRKTNKEKEPKIGGKATH